MSQLQNEIETLENRANELRDRRDFTATESTALDARVALGDVEAIGDAASKRAEMDVISRALDGVESDANELRGQAEAGDVAAARESEIAHVQQLARDALAIDADARKMATKAAAALAKNAEFIVEAQARARSIRNELASVAKHDPDVLSDAISTETLDALGYTESGFYPVEFQAPLLFDGDAREINGASGLLLSMQGAANRMGATPSATPTGLNNPLRREARATAPIPKHKDRRAA